jgi:hypothetical protein
MELSYPCALEASAAITPATLLAKSVGRMVNAVSSSPCSAAFKTNDLRNQSLVFE